MEAVRPFDPRLLRHVPALRRDVALLAVLGIATAISIVVAATGLAEALAALCTPAAGLASPLLAAPGQLAPGAAASPGVFGSVGQGLALFVVGLAGRAV